MGNADNRYLWQPRLNGPVHIRIAFRLPGDSNSRTFVRSLGTRSYPEARRVRDRSFLPLISLLNSAQTAYQFAEHVVKTAQTIIGRDLSSFMAQLDPLREAPEIADASNLGGARGRGSDLIWGELSKKYLDHKQGMDGNGHARRADSTITKYTKEVSVIDDFFGRGTAIRQIDRRRIALLLEQLVRSGTYADTTVNFYMDRVGAIFKFGIARGLIDHNPAAGVRIEGAKQKQRRAFTDKEADAVLALTPPNSKKWPAYVFTAFGMIARYTGARLGEIAFLRAEDVVEVQGVRCLSFLTEKTGSRRGSTPAQKYRYVPIAPKLMYTVDKCLLKQPRDLLFPQTGSWKWKPAHALGKALNRAIKKVAHDCSFHSWRHYALTEMMNAGVPREIRLQIAGHKDDSVHGGYTHAKIQSMLEAIETIH